GDDVLNKIGRLPEADQHCASLAALTIQDALTNFMNKDK
ncbi:MAG: iron-sulfur cluster assembly scaffold protein, partial [Deltaproteobacteria bacterium]